MRRLRWLAALAASLCIAAAARAAEPAPVRFGSVGGLTDAGLYLADEYGYFKEAGVAVAMQRMPNAPTLLTALATDQLDIAGIAVTPGLFAALQQGIELRIVGDKQSIGPGFSATRLVVRPDLVRGLTGDPIAALAGKTVAVSAKASSPYMDLAQLLAARGLGSGPGPGPGNVAVVELAYPNMTAALGSGAIDGAVMLEPYLTEAIKAGVALEISDLGTKPGVFRITVPLVYSEAFVKRRAVAQAFMTAYVRGVRIYNDAFVKGIDKAKVIAIIARRAEIDPAIVRDAFPAGLDPDQRVNVASLEACQQFFIAQHFLERPVAIDKVYDPSFAAAAVAQLGPYH